MPTIRKGALFAGLVAGAAIGTVYVASKRYAERTEPSLVDWAQARRVAYRLTRPAAGALDLEAAGLRYADLVRHVSPQIAQYAGVDLPESLGVVRAIDRPEWVDTNLGNFELMLTPLENTYTELLSRARANKSALRGVSQYAISSEMGGFLAYLATRVLGQYDTDLMGREPLSDSRLYFLEPNIRGTAHALGLRRDEFETYIAIHETTHALEFGAFPWLRDHINQTMLGYLESASHDLLHMGRDWRAMGELARKFFENLAEGRHWSEFATSTAQKRHFDTLQATMCLVEGYSNHIMNQVGSQILPSYEEIRRKLEERRAQRGPLMDFFEQFTGLSIKMEQYRLGEQFVDEVTRAEGIAFLNRAWERPENLPTMREVRRPADWVARIKQPAGQ